ncbi:MAG: hypothetical protein JRH01_21525 [Deltaproteobacteria bacterium]|nr:hypothetical protein [Deltaproteobacteria bacterium]MBW2394448.1 hypothetical protein [Deltaproteobacteria bacterium]
MSRGRGWDEPPLPEGERSHGMPGWQVAGLGLAAAATLLGVLLALEPSPERLPAESLPGLSSKFAYVEEHRDELDIFFVGSSRVLRGIVPERVDAALAALGCPGVRSYNLGFAGMSAPTMARVAEVASRGPSERPRLVLIEPMGAFGPALRTPTDARARFGNRASTVPLGFLQIWARPAPGVLGERPIPRALIFLGVAPSLAISIDLSVEYLGTLATTELGVGRAQRFAFGVPKLGGPESPQQLAQRGYFSLEQAAAEASGEWRTRLLERRMDPVADRERFALVTRQMAEAAVAPAEPLSTVERLFVERLLASGDGPHSRAGALLPPTIHTHNQKWVRDVAHHLAKTAPEQPVAIVPPDELPELYEMENWHDRGHLAERGARLFSEALASDLCPSTFLPEGGRSVVRTGSR